MITTLDVAVLVLYLVGVAVFGIVAGGRQKSGTDYFLGGRDMPWWAICFSIVATETSTLTVIGIPAVAYLGGLAFLQLTLGYLLGRIGVAILFVPRYFDGSLVSAYGLLGKRFGNRMRATASVTFMVTRLLADGVRLFAGAIPIKVIAQSAGWSISYFEIILAIGLVTIAYTYVGGLKAVIWMDVVQMVLYVGGALLAVVLLMRHVDSAALSEVLNSDKARIFVSGSDLSFSEWLTQPYTFVTAVVGGGIFSLASHGTDQLIVQRLLACRTQRESKMAVVSSAVLVMFQFSIFLFVGLLLWLFYDHAPLTELGLSRGDEVFPKFIVEEMPAGVSGLLIAGILAAAMSTLSSSLNALASTSVSDIYERFKSDLSATEMLKVSRIFTLLWGLVFIGFANLFESQTSPVVELGLAIASFTYGGLLGAFLLGILNKNARERDALIAFAFTIAFMVWVIFGVWYSQELQTWIIEFYPSEATKSEFGLRGIAWPWYTAIGAAVLMLTSSIIRIVAPGSERNPEQ
jgi:SSS family solute:Na+ symporter